MVLFTFIFTPKSIKYCVYVMVYNVYSNNLQLLCHHPLAKVCKTRDIVDGGIAQKINK